MFTNNAPSPRPHATVSGMKNSHATVTPLANPALSFTLAEHLREHYAPDLSAVQAILRHPRCLARTASTWRPPTRVIPDPLSGGELIVALTRHRIGPRARARIRGFDPSHTAAYLLSLRFSRTDGQPVHPATAEAWVRALLPEESIDSVHEFLGESAPTYRWCVDGGFQPVASPASLFAGASAA